MNKREDPWKPPSATIVASGMQVKAVSYSMLRATKSYENDRVEVTIELDKKDKLGDVVRKAKKICDAALRSKEPASDHSFEVLLGEK